MKTDFSCLALLLALLILPARAGAANPGTKVSDCPSNPACLSLLQQAREQSGQGNLGDAAGLYKAAYEVRADPGLLFNIARVLHKQGQTQEAAAYYQEFLNSPSGDAAQKRRAQEYLNQLPRREDPPLPVPPVQSPAPILSLNPASAAEQTPSLLIQQAPQDAEQTRKVNKSLNQFPRPENPPPPALPVQSTPLILSPNPTSWSGQTPSVAFQSPLAKPDARSASTPLYKKWWLWTIIGSAGAAGAVGLGVGLAVRPPSLPSGINTYQPGF